MTLTVYEQVAKRRTNWTPVTPAGKEYLVDEASTILSKALALRALELPVKDFINDGLSKKEAELIGIEGKKCLIRNTEDEEKHDLALNNCVKVCSNYDSIYESEVKLLVKAWIDHPDHPITKAATLENGIFFLILPLMRRYGNTSLRTTSIDISSDEVNHVQSHRYAATQMNQKVSPSLDTLRKATVAWIVDGFKFEHLTADTLMKASNNLMYRGVAPELEFTQSYSVPAFFERRNDTLPYYN